MQPKPYLALLCFVAAAACAAPPVNVLVIVSDDEGYADVGFQGCKDIPTPNIDQLARAGVRFTNGYVSAPYCSPSRAGLLTGRYQQRFGHEFNPGANSGLPVTETTLADHLKSSGYVTGAIGKWHLGSQRAMHPQQRGFDEFFGFLGGQHSYFDAAGVMRGTEPVKQIGYTTDTFADEACSFIDRHKGERWFLYLAFNAVHTPMHATDGRIAKFAQMTDEQRRTYAAMSSALDDAVGKVRARLAQTGQEQNTLVVYLSDNGGPIMTGTTINGSRNDPLRGGKRTLLEGGVRVPFVVAWPGHLKPGVYAQPVNQLDLHATALAAAQVAPKAEWKLDGVDLMPYLAGRKTGTPHDALYWRFGSQMAIRSGDWKLVRYDAHADGNPGKERRPAVTALKLYNLASDIHEDNDLAASHPEKVRELQAKWDKWNADNIAPRWGAGRGDDDGPEPGAPRGHRGKAKRR